ncbi:NAD-dependent epimerase/dehydratase family protein [Halovenus marina]|uniref:NAD-dependent epimerase/dehydratase family protein n=1 Tax=Halovenus marina TaxID=3396621 RepID=UPI003F5692CB
MEQALVIGGTRFIGRHLVTELLDHDYAVTLFNRGTHENPFADNDSVGHIAGDRRSGAALKAARDAVDPDLVVDCVAYYPGEVRMATRVFEAVDAYVFISSGAAYGPDVIPKREDETPLEPCSDDEAVDDSERTYGARKAEGDRAVFEAAENSVQAMSVRPPIVYGPYDYTGRFAYWVDRVRDHDRVLVPGDGTNIHHLVAVENVVRGIRAVAEEGTAGEAYNVANRRILTLGDLLESIADALDTDVELVTAGARELGRLEPTDFPLYNPNPHILSTAKLADLNWDPVDVQTTIANAVDDPAEPERDPGPDVAETRAVLDRLV